MATYAIGDIHGCWATLEGLLERIRFSSGRDRLWLVGDLVNRGPRSLAVLRWARGLGDGAVVVLGNHDLHLLARAAGVAERRRRDTLEEVLAAPDRGELLAWLASRPLLHREGGRVLVHAGLLPGWSLERAGDWAREVEAALAGPEGTSLLQAVRCPPYPAWRASLPREEALRLALYAFAFLRCCDARGRPCHGFNGRPDEAPEGCRPWFAERSGETGVTFVCGHWAALGLRLAPGLAALDSACVWGGPLTALRLEDGEVFQQENLDGALERRPASR